jgi:two-component sensor histidine kinase
VASSPIEEMKRELAAASVDLLGNDDLLRGVLAGCGDCIKILDLDGRLQFVSEGGKRVMEVEDFSALKGCPWPDFWAGEGHGQAIAAIAGAKDGRTMRFRNAADTAKGNPRFWDVQVSPIIGADGTVSHLLSISRDITEEWRAAEIQRQYIENQRFLADELTHRVKNTLATVIGIAHQTFRGDIYREAREVFDTRLHTLASAYNILTESSWAESDIRLVIEGTIAPYRIGPNQFLVDGPAFSLTPSRAFILALAINELATNAMKYGALSQDGGHVQMRWSKEPIEGVQAFQFEWREHGGPAVVAPTRTGFGSRLIKRLAKEFNGTIDLRYEPKGLTCRLDSASR